MGINLSTEQKRRIEQEERERVRERIASGEPANRPCSRMGRLVISITAIS